MNDNKTIVPLEKYNITCIYDISDYKEKDSSKITNVFWFPNPIVNDKLVSFCKKNGYSNVLEIGPGVSPFKIATTFIGLNEKVSNYINVDINDNKLPFPDKHFDFTYCRHVLEDIQNPNFALSEIKRVSKSFYIETPSPLVEITRGVDAPKYSYKYRGYIHHRYFIWVDYFTNTIHMLPKFPMIETVLELSETLQNRINYILNNYPVYWNTYLICENLNDVNIKIHNNTGWDEYASLIEKAVNTTIENVNYFINKIEHIL